jgi:polygalacturonase
MVGSRKKLVVLCGAAFLLGSLGAMGSAGGADGASKTAAPAEANIPQSLVTNVVLLGADPKGERDSSQAFLKALDKGGTIVVPPGTYLIRKTLALARSGTTLCGQGGAVLSFPPGFLDTGLAVKGEPFGLKNIAIRNLTLRCDKANYTPGKNGKYAFGIYLFGVDEGVVEGCTVNWFNFTAIGVAASKNVRIDRCTTLGGRHGISVNGQIGNPKAGGQPYGCRYTSIDNCRVNETWDTFIAIGLCASHVTVNGCMCEGSAAHGFDIFNSDNIVVTGNLISNWMDPRVLSPYGEQSVGIFIHCDWGNSVEIPTRNIVVSGNVLVRDRYPANVRPVGISLTGTVDGVSVTGNVVRGGFVGCAVTDVGGDKVRYAPQAVSITGNSFLGQKASLWVDSETPMSVLFSANNFTPSVDEGSIGHIGEKTQGVWLQGNVAPHDKLPAKMPPGGF